MTYSEIERIFCEDNGNRKNIYLKNGEDFRSNVILYYPYQTFLKFQDDCIRDIVSHLIKEEIFNVDSDFNKELGTKEWKFDQNVRQRVYDEKNPYRATIAVRNGVLEPEKPPRFEQVMRCVFSYSDAVDAIVDKYYKRLQRKRAKKTIQSILYILFEDIFWVGENEEIYRRVEGFRKDSRLLIASRIEWVEAEKRRSVELDLRERENRIEREEKRLQGVGQAGIKQADFDVNTIRKCTVYAIEIEEEIVYVGCTWRNVNERWKEHMDKAREGSGKGLYVDMREKQVVFRVLWEGQANRLQLEAMEYGFICLFRPKYNLEGMSKQYRFSVGKDKKVWKGRRVKNWKMEIEKGLRQLK